MRCGRTRTQEVRNLAETAGRLHRRQAAQNLPAVGPRHEPRIAQHQHAAVGFLLHAARLDTKELGNRRNLSMPGISATVGEQIEALRKVAGDKAARLIRREPDPTIMRIVEGWPRNFDTKRALALGFRADASFEDIVRIHITDELQGTPQPRPGSA